MAKFINRGHHDPTGQYIYWTSPEYDPQGNYYEEPSPPFTEISNVVVVDKRRTSDLGDNLFYDDLSDQGDGATSTFVLSGEPFQDYIDVFVNGLRQTEDDDFQLDTNGDVVFIGFTPHSSDNVAAYYFRT